MTRKEKIQWLINNLNLYPLAKSEKSLYRKMTDSDLDSLINIEKGRNNKPLGKKEVSNLVSIIRRYQKGTEAYKRPWTQWMVNCELKN